MGVGGGFWEIVKPLCHRSQDLSTLAGKRLAIDLSFWIVQQEAVLRDRARKPHLRLLFFRVVTLIAKVGALPVFVVDGEAPLLKLPARIERFSRLSGIPAAQLTGCGGSRNQAFTNNVEECVELLELLGVPVLRATGEAEALCAELERKGIVDACVTPDSDALLHGASYVIQTLQADMKNPLVESYFASEIKSVLQLGRQHLIALALLVGCDYDTQGIPGIGYARALRLVRCFPEDVILDKLRMWGSHQLPSLEEIGRMSGTELDEQENDNGRKNPHCSNCGHPGNKKIHMNLGCNQCHEEATAVGCIQKANGFKCTCASCSQKQRRKKRDKDVHWWSGLCAKISAIEGFPNDEIIDLFLNSTNRSYLAEGQQSLSGLQCQLPKMQRLESFLNFHLHWDGDYIRRKAFPLLSYFCLKSLAQGFPVLLDDRYAPDSIQKTKTIQAKQFYVVSWKSMVHSTEADANMLLTTDEEASLVRKACPDLVANFEDKKQQKSKKARKKPASRDSTQTSIKSFFKSKSWNGGGGGLVKRRLIDDEEEICAKRRLFP